MNQALKNFFFVATVLLLGTVIYSNTLHASWHFDDYEFIVLNKGLRHIADLPATWQTINIPARAVAFVTFALNYHFGALNVKGYHLVNIAIHLSNALLVWLLIRLLCRTPQVAPSRVASRKDFLSAGVALLFLVHPVQTEAVTYITQRFASLAAFFYLASVIFYICARLSPNKLKRGGCFAVFFLAGLLGMFTKQTVLTLPVTVLCVEFYFFRDLRQWQEIKKSWRWYYVLPFIALFIIVPTLYKWDFNWFHEIKGLSRSHPGDIVNVWTYFLTQFRVLPVYLRLLVAPLGQTLDYDFTVSQSVLDPKVLLGACFLGGIFLYGLRMYSRNRLVAFGILWFFLTLAVESTFIPILQVIFEHRCYLPSVGIFLVFMVWLTEHLRKSRAWTVLVLLVLTFSYLTYQRNKVWATEISLWQDINRKAPQKERPYVHLGVAYLMAGNYKEALEKLTQAIRVDPSNYEAFHNRGIVYGEINHLDLALADFNKALSLNNRSAETFNGRGTIYEKMGRLPQAFADYSRAIELDSHKGGAYANRANILIRTGHYAQALKDLTAAQADGYPVNAATLQKLKKMVGQNP